MKKLFINLIGLFLVAGAANAATYSTNIAISANTNTPDGILVAGAVQINSITIANTGIATNGVYTFYDTARNLRWTNTGTFTNRVQYLATNIDLVTNFYGVVQTTTNVSLYTSNAVTTGTTNFFKILTSMAVNSNTTTTFTPPSTMVGGFGIGFTNVGGGTITLNYSTIP